jgi:signal transduction histidine kinase
MLLGMVTLTRRMVSLERSEQVSELRAEYERLALWRLESHILPIVVRESSRIYNDDFFSSHRNLHLPADVVYFYRANAEGKLQGTISTGGQSTSHISHSEYTSALTLAMLTRQEQSLASEPENANAPSLSSEERFAQNARKQSARSQNEFLNRAMNSINNFEMISEIQQASNQLYFDQPLPDPLVAFWAEDQLYMARFTKALGPGTSEGCLLNWSYLREVLLGRIKDLFPNADLVPAAHDSVEDHHVLAALPLRLIPGEPNIKQLTTSSFLKPTLFIAWGCFTFSAVAIGLLFLGVVRLSERRAAFVSAVTHELRTPLTTFRLYTDLLQDRNRLSDDKYSRYVEILKSESQRLQHLIENVLGWSRLERSAVLEESEELEWNSFFSRLRPALEDRLQRAGMTLLVRVDETQPIVFRANRTGVERILYNLVDNAAKYAKSAESNQVHLEVSIQGNEVVMLLRDHGPGIALKTQAKLFQPFSKSASEAAKSAPGIGLGLSLSRRLAIDMGGSLKLISTSPTGTVFELRLAFKESDPISDRL